MVGLLVNVLHRPPAKRQTIPLCSSGRATQELVAVCEDDGAIAESLVLLIYGRLGVFYKSLGVTCSEREHAEDVAGRIVVLSIADEADDPPNPLPVALCSDFQDGTGWLIAVCERLIAVASNGIGFQCPEMGHGLHEEMPLSEQLLEVSGGAKLHKAHDRILLQGIGWVSNKRLWIERRPNESCPKCGGDLKETEERRRETKSGYATRKECQAAMNKLLVILR